MADIGELNLKVKVDKSEVEGLSDDIGTEANGASDEVLKALDKVTHGNASTVNDIVNGEFGWGTALAAVTAVIAAEEKLAGVGDDVAKGARKLGWEDVERYQEWAYVLSQAGTNIDTISNMYTPMMKKFDSTPALLDKIGLSYEQLEAMKPAEAVVAVNAAINENTDTIEANGIRMDIFGRKQLELNLINGMTVETIDEEGKKLRDLGGLYSGEALDACEEFKDTQEDMFTALGGFLKTILMPLMPVLTSIMQVLNPILGIVNAILEPIGMLMNVLLKPFIDMLNSVGEALKFIVGLIRDIGDIISDWGEGIFEGLFGGIADLFGSHATGLAYVPYDGYPAILHRGERVLTRDENRTDNINSRVTNGGSNVTNVFNIPENSDPYRTAQEILRKQRGEQYGYLTV